MFLTTIPLSLQSITMPCGEEDHEAVLSSFLVGDCRLLLCALQQGYGPNVRHAPVCNQRPPLFAIQQLNGHGLWLAEAWQCRGAISAYRC